MTSAWMFAVSMALSLPMSANVFAAASSPYAAIPLLRDESAGDMPIAARVVIVMLALLAPLAWWLRRRRGGLPGFSFSANFGAGLGKRQSGSAAPVVRSVTRLNAATSLYVVEWQSQSLLIACAGEQVNVLERSPLTAAESSQCEGKDSQ